MPSQHPITLVTPIAEGRLTDLRAKLRHIKAELSAEEEKARQRIFTRQPFETIGTIHYCRWLIIDEDIPKGTSSLGDMPKLVFSSNFDGSVEDQLRGLCTDAGHFIDHIYAHCEGYPANPDPEARYQYLNRWMIKPSAFYQGSRNRTVRQIRQESRLRNFIRDFLDQRNWDNNTSVTVHREIREAVLAQPEFAWVKDPITIPRVNWPGMVLVGIVLLLLLPLIITWILIIEFRYERRDSYFTLKRSQLDEAKIKTLEEYEDLEPQNQFSQLVTMKDGAMRLATYQAMMAFARVLIQLLFVKGKLMGIPTIHFARWVLFDNKKRVLFFSNFDGSWQQYLGDFIDQSGWGLTGIFSNTKNFPKAKFLLMGGAYDEERFLAWSRSTEVQTLLWYSAYPHLSIKNVNNNTRIRHLLVQDLSETEATQFLKLL